MRKPLLTLLWLAVSATAFPASSPGASFSGLGFVPGGNDSGATGVSAVGSLVVGGSNLTSNIPPGVFNAFRWTSSGGMVGLGVLPGDGTSVAEGVSADGSTTVGFSCPVTNTVNNCATESHAFRWTSSGGMVGLGSLPGGSTSDAHGVSADGSVVVGDSSSLRGGQAFRWTLSDGMIGLGFLPGDNLSSAAAVSADGSVVVGTSALSGGVPQQGFRWTASGGMVGLGFLPGGAFSAATSVSADGAVVVGVSGPLGVLGEGFRWTASGGMVGLGSLPGDDASTPFAVSADGSVVVGNSQVSGSLAQARAFIWDAAHGMRPLQGVLTADGLDLTGWVLAAAEGISADGNTIVGTGIHSTGIHPDRLPEAWIATLVRADVVIEVQPFIPNDPIVLNSPLPLPVIVLGSSTVDVTQIDATTLSFGPKGAAPVFTQIIPVDGQKDLLALFEVQDTGLALGDKQACLQGKIGGEAFRGCDDVVVIMFRGCGLGFELAPILPVLLWLRGRQRRMLA